jgi:hypothetical protein
MILERQARPAWVSLDPRRNLVTRFEDGILVENLKVRAPRIVVTIPVILNGLVSTHLCAIYVRLYVLYRDTEVLLVAPRALDASTVYDVA